MSDEIKNGETRLKIYAFLADGIAQTKVASVLQLDKGYVSRIAREFVTKGYLEIVKGTKSPKLYQKGPNGNHLDKVILDQRLTIYTRGVKNPSLKLTKPLLGRMHHLKFKMEVKQEGCLSYYYIGRKYRNIQRSYAEVPYKEHFVKLELERSFKKGGKTALYVYPPQMDLTSGELPNYIQISENIVNEIANYLMRNKGWTLGDPERTNWQLHIGVDDPGSMKGLADKFCMRSKDGKAILSNSEGRSEYEVYEDIQLAQIKLDLPGEVQDLKASNEMILSGQDTMSSRLTILEENTQRLIGISENIQEALSNIATAGSLLTEKAVSEAIDQVNERGIMYR